MPGWQADEGHNTEWRVGFVETKWEIADVQTCWIAGLRAWITSVDRIDTTTEIISTK